jgi:hypothetical protein
MLCGIKLFSPLSMYFWLQKMCLSLEIYWHAYYLRLAVILYFGYWYFMGYSNQIDMLTLKMDSEIRDGFIGPI